MTARGKFDSKLLFQLIDGYKKYPSVYDTKHQLHNESKEAFFLIMTQELQKSNASITVDDVRMKIEWLRQQLPFEHLKVVNGLEPLWWYHPMEFLLPHLNKHTSETPVPKIPRVELVDIATTMPSTSMQQPATVQTQQAQKRKRIEPKCSYDEDLQIFLGYLNAELRGFRNKKLFTEARSAIHKIISQINIQQQKQ